MQVQRPAGIAARAGLVTGLFVGVLSLPVITISGVTGGRGLLWLFLLVALVAFAIAGYTATRRSGRIRSGVGAGALAAGVTMFIAICFGIVIVALLAPHAPLGGARGGRILLRQLARLAILRLLAGTLFIFGAGLLGGFIGGLLSRLGMAPRGRAPGGGAPRFTPPPAAAYTPAGGAYTPGDPGLTTPQPFYPPAPPYDGDAPTIITTADPQP